MLDIEWVDYSCKLINPIPEEDMLRHIEYCGRVCYNSYDKMDYNNYDNTLKFVKNIINRGHTSVLEHSMITVEVVLDRGLSHEWVRHRVGSAYSQQSTRYCKFMGKIQCIMPTSLRGEDVDEIIKRTFTDGVKAACDSYAALLERGIAPQIARGTLPNCLATKLMATHNLREWQHILNMRLYDEGAHPDMRYLMSKVFYALSEQYPNIFVR